jgi:multidrug resistance efflux pump
MSQSSLETAQARLQKLQEKQAELKAQISREEARIRESERKARTRRLIEYGGLVDLAELTTMDKGTLLGMFLEGARRIGAGDEVVKQWKRAGDKLLGERATERRQVNDKKRGKPQADSVTNGKHDSAAVDAAVS